MSLFIQIIHKIFKLCYNLLADYYSNVLKFLTLLFLFSNKISVIVAGIHKMLVRKVNTGKPLIRLLVQKQSDLGLHCLSRPSSQTTIVQNFETFTVML